MNLRDDKLFLVLLNGEIHKNIPKKCKTRKGKKKNKKKKISSAIWIMEWKVIPVMFHLSPNRSHITNVIRRNRPSKFQNRPCSSAFTCAAHVARGPID